MKFNFIEKSCNKHNRKDREKNGLAHILSSCLFYHPFFYDLLAKTYALFYIYCSGIGRHVKRIMDSLCVVAFHNI